MKVEVKVLGSPSLGRKVTLKKKKKTNNTQKAGLAQREDVGQVSGPQRFRSTLLLSFLFKKWDLRTLVSAILPLTMNKTLKRLSSILILQQKSSW